MRSSIIAALCLGALCACSGGGASSVVPAPAKSPAGGTAPATLKVVIPRASQTAARKPAYISPSTASIKLVVDTLAGGYTPYGQPTIVNVSSCPVVSGNPTCTISFVAPIGTVYLSVSAYDAPNAGGNLLSISTSYIPEQVVVGANTFSIALFGNETTARVTQDRVLEPGGTAALSFAAYDADGNQIVGSDPLDTFIQTTCSSTSPIAISACGTNMPNPSSGNGSTLTYADASAGTPTQTLSLNPFVTFSPVVDWGTTASPATLTFAGPSAPAQSVTIAGQALTSATLNGCGNATATLAGNVVTVAPGTSTIGACALTVSGGIADATTYNAIVGASNFGVSWAASVTVPIFVGADATVTQPYASPYALRFAGASSASQSLAIYPGSGYTGPVYLQAIQCRTMSGSAASTSATANESATANVVAISPASGSSTSGSPVVFTISPKLQGTCDLNATSSAPSAGTYGSGNVVFAQPFAIVGP